MKYYPPKKAQQNAIEARKCIENGSNAMLRTGRYRSAQLASGTPISYGVVKRMSQFARHRKNKYYTGEPCNDRGYVAWQGWGGDEGISWAKKIVKSNRLKK